MSVGSALSGRDRNNAASPCNRRFYSVRRVAAEKVTGLQGTLTRCRLLAAIGLIGSLAGSCLGRCDGVRDREQCGVVFEQLDHFRVERQLALR